MGEGAPSDDGRSSGLIPDEELLMDLRRVADEVGDSPSMADYDERGTYSPSTCQSRFGSWTEAKERAGLPSGTGGVEYADAELLEALRAFADELGETPTRAQMRTDGPHAPSTYAARFGSWTDALEAAGFDGRERATGIPEADLVAELRRVTEAMGRCPTSEEFDERGRYSAATYFRQFDSWADALARASVADDYPAPSRRQVSNDDLTAELRRLADALGRPPTESEMGELGDHSPETYRQRYGSWADALRGADLDPDLRPTGGEKNRVPTATLVADVKRVAEECGRAPTVEEIRESGEYGAATYLDRFGSWNDALAAAGLDSRRCRRDGIPTRELVRELRTLALELGRRPRRADMDQQGPYAGTTYYNRFGSWDGALDAAGIRTEDGRTSLRGYCDACGAKVNELLADCPSDEGLFCDEACRAVGTQSTVRFESDVLDASDGDRFDAARGDHLGRLAAAISGGDVMPSRLLFCLRRAIELLDSGFGSATVDGYDCTRDGDTVVVAWESGSDSRELRFEVETVRAVKRRLDAVERRQVSADRRGHPVAED